MGRAFLCLSLKVLCNETVLLDPSDHTTCKLCLSALSCRFCIPESPVYMSQRQARPLYIQESALLLFSFFVFFRSVAGIWVSTLTEAWSSLLSTTVAHAYSWAAFSYCCSMTFAQSKSLPFQLQTAAVLVALMSEGTVHQTFKSELWQYMHDNLTIHR